MSNFVFGTLVLRAPPAPEALAQALASAAAHAGIHAVHAADGLQPIVREMLQKQVLRNIDAAFCLALTAEDDTSDALIESPHGWEQITCWLTRCFELTSADEAHVFIVDGYDVEFECLTIAASRLRETIERKMQDGWYLPSLHLRITRS